MQLVAPDILEQAKGLSVVACIGILVFGLVLWMTGWLANRFWIAFFATVGAGVFGLFNASHYGVQPLVGGLLLALTAGLLAKLLVRLLAYFAGGLAGLVIVHVLYPSWSQPIISVLAGGLLGVLLFRFWVMLFTSALGSFLMVYSCLCLMDTLGKLDMAGIAKQRAPMLNYVCGGVIAGGLALQFILDRLRSRFGGKGGGDKAAKPPAPKKSIVQWGLESLKKVA